MAHKAHKSTWWLSLTGTALLLFIASAPASALITNLELVIGTGGDDLRGGNDNVNATVLLRDGRQINFDNINRSVRWENGSQHTVPLHFNLTIDRGIASRDDIIGLKLQTTFRGGIGGDNWDLGYLKVTPVDHSVGGGGRLAPYYEKNGRSGGRPLWRFTGDNHLFVARWASQPDEVSHLRLVIRTGNDDLRGGNDNLNLRIQYRGGEQYVPNINASKRWADGSTEAVRVALDRPARLSDIMGVILETSSGGGTGGDNWNMNALRIIPQMLGQPSFPDCFNSQGRPLKRFTGKYRTFQARCR